MWCNATKVHWSPELNFQFIIWVRRTWLGSLAEVCSSAIKLHLPLPCFHLVLQPGQYQVLLSCSSQLQQIALFSELGWKLVWCFVLGKCMSYKPVGHADQLFRTKFEWNMSRCCCLWDRIMYRVASLAAAMARVGWWVTHCTPQAADSGYLACINSLWQCGDGVHDSGRGCRHWHGVPRTAVQHRSIVSCGMVASAMCRDIVTQWYRRVSASTANPTQRKGLGLEFT